MLRNWKMVTAGGALLTALAIMATDSITNQQIPNQAQIEQTLNDQTIRIDTEQLLLAAANAEIKPTATDTLKALPTEQSKPVLASRSGQLAHNAPAKQAIPASAGTVMQMTASAYGPPNINWKFGGKTYSGTTVRQGVIAVDPNVIPLGTKVWISGYNHPNLPAGGFMAVAEDIGGAIHGKRVDIFINTDDLQSLRNFGFQTVQVKILN